MKEAGFKEIRKSIHKYAEHGREVHCDAAAYRIEFPTKGGPRGCPVEGCPGRAGRDSLYESLLARARKSWGRLKRILRS